MTTINTTNLEAINARISRRPVSTDGVLGYHALHRSTLKFLGLKKNGTLTRIEEPGNRLFYGIEVEICSYWSRHSADTCANYARDIMTGKGLRDIEHDGSIHGDGLELITEPCTLQAACYGLPWDELCATLDALGCRANDGETNCGIHVHVSRAGLGMSPDAIDMVCAKLLVLMDRFTEQLVKFARRDWTTEYYCRKYDSFTATGENSTKKMLKKFKETAKREGENGERYRCLNLTNRGTIEFRIFKSTLSPLSIRAIFQLCDAMVQFCKSHTTPEIQACTWSELIGSCKLPELATYCERRGIA